MSLQAITVDADLAGKGAPGAPTFHDRLSFGGDDNYTTGGTLGFDALVTAALKRTATILDVISGDCGDHYVVYKPADGGTLMVFLRSTGAELGNGVDLNATTFNVGVISQ